MGKELIVIRIKIHILDNGCLIRRMVKVCMNMLQINKRLWELGRIIKLYKENGYSLMDHIIWVNLKIINLMAKEHGI